jgi:hypothetical protein
MLTVVEQTTETDREMNLRFAGVCTVCGEEIPKGTRAVYSPSSRSVHHTACPGLERGAAGASARREFERRKARDDARIEARKDDVRATFGDGFIGKVATFLAVDDSPRRSTSVWAQGAVGEERVAAQLDALAEVGVIALHDRRIPGTKANIDHIAVTPWGVWVIDAKRYLNKRPDLVTEGGFLGIGGTDRLTVGGRKQDKLVDGMLWQLEKVQAVLGETASARGILCFVDADWPLIGGHFSVRGVRVVWPRRLPKELLQTVPPTIDAQTVARALASAFPPA